MALVTTTLSDALISLKTAFERSIKEPHDLEVRDACIQRFEYSFELSWKLLKRRLELEIGVTEEVDAYSKKQLFRVGGERGLIKNVEAWFEYLDKRNLTVHTYDEANAREVYSVIGDFLKDAESLLNEIKSRRD